MTTVSRSPLTHFLLMLTCAASVPQCASGDAIVVNKSMSASTIVEIFVEDDQVRIDLEIGANDVHAFANLLPDELYRAIADDESVPAARTRRFFENDLVVQADGTTLKGNLELIEVRPRVVRDEITGEPLPVQPPDQEIIIHAIAVWDLERQPSSLTIRPPVNESGRSRATVGFILMHRGLPVTDFRYLSGEETVDLDWSDPWYSRFRNRNLRRQYDAPLSVFLYVEHFEVRVEVIARPRDLQSWVDLGVGDLSTLPVKDQADTKARVASLLTDQLELTIDGVPATLELDRIHFIRRTLKQTGVVDPPEPMDLTSATLGVILVHPIDDLPQHVQLEWPFFNDQIQSIPVVATDQAGGLPGTVTPDDNLVEWKNFLTNPVAPTMLEVPAPPTRSASGLFLAVIVAFLFGGWVVVRVLRKWRSGNARLILDAVPLLAVVVVAFVCMRNGAPALQQLTSGRDDLRPIQQKELVHSLLHNTYRAFDRRAENIVFEQLSQSVAGDLLETAYLEFRKALELSSQGGAQASVEEVKVLDVSDPTQVDSGGFLAQVTWEVSGAVGHWGHTHRRVNQYTAHLSVQPHDDRWKMTSLRMIDSTPVTAIDSSGR